MKRKVKDGRTVCGKSFRERGGRREGERRGEKVFEGERRGEKGREGGGRERVETLL